MFVKNYDAIHYGSLGHHVGARVSRKTEGYTRVSGYYGYHPIVGKLI